MQMLTAALKHLEFAGLTTPMSIIVSEESEGGSATAGERNENKPTMSLTAGCKLLHVSVVPTPRCLRRPGRTHVDADGAGARGAAPAARGGGRLRARNVPQPGAHEQPGRRAGGQPCFPPRDAIVEHLDEESNHTPRYASPHHSHATLQPASLWDVLAKGKFPKEVSMDCLHTACM